MTVQDIPQQPNEAILYAATEAGEAHADTQKILELLTPSGPQADPLAAIIDALEMLNNKMDRVLDNLPPR